MIKEYKHLIKLQRFPMEQIYFKCVRVIELDEGIDNTKTEDIDISKTEDIDISKTEDIDISKTEDKDEDTDRDMLIRAFRCVKQWHGKKMAIGKEDKLSGSFGIMVMYQNYVESGYILMINMHTQGLKGFIHIWGRCFENIRQLHQKISQTHT